MLLAADVVGLLAAFVLTEVVFGVRAGSVHPDIVKLFLFFLVSLPGWAIGARIYGLYDRDEDRTDHSTTDDVVGVFHLVTVAVWVLYAGAWLTDWTTPKVSKTAVFWCLAIVLITTARAVGRSVARRSSAYLQNVVVVGAGDVGQLVGRKYALHPEYGISLIALADDEEHVLRNELAGVPRIGLADVVPMVESRPVDRVVIALTQSPQAPVVELVRELRRLDVQVDLLPALYEVVPPNVQVHAVEGLPLLGLRPLRMSRSSRLAKRAIDLVAAATLLALLSPLFTFVAWRVRRDSPGPIFFRQTRLGEGMKEFTALKFRTMTHADHETAHRTYVESIMSTEATVGENGLYKLERPDVVTKVGRWLRATSLDELPQLINVVRGDMSLVGPRPCIPYETELFEPRHFDRFAVPAGITGLWQVTARARSTFLEALDLDVQYALNWSLSLDLQLLARTPLHVLRRKGTT